MSKSVVLERALEILKQDGWMQRESTPTRLHCAVTALYEVAPGGRDPIDWQRHPDESVLALDQVIQEQYPEVSFLSEDPITRIILWNDHPGRTWDEVATMFEKAAAKEDQ